MTEVESSSKRRCKVILLYFGGKPTIKRICLIGWGYKTARGQHSHKTKTNPSMPTKIKGVEGRLSRLSYNDASFTSVFLSLTVVPGMWGSMVSVPYSYPWWNRNLPQNPNSFHEAWRICLLGFILTHLSPPEVTGIFVMWKSIYYPHGG